jgi:hypothetical protein
MKCPANRKTIKIPVIYMHAIIIWRLRFFLFRCSLIPSNNIAVLTGLMMGRSVISVTKTDEKKAVTSFIKYYSIVKR